MNIGIRPATRADADVVCALVAALSAEEGMVPPALTPSLFRRQGFGRDPLFTALLAERAGQVAGMVLLTRGYDSQSASAGLVVENLYVEPLSRRAGVGRALMAEAARCVRERGLEWLSWHVRRGNVRAQLFYRSLGAVTEAVELMALSDTALTALADER